VCCHAADPFCARAAAGLRKRRWRNLLDHRQKSGKLREEEKKIQFIAQGAIRGNLRRIRESFLDFTVKAFLKHCDTRVVTQSLPRRMGKTRRVRWRGECGDPTSLSFLHFRAAELRRSCSYHVWWCLSAQARETSPRITEPNAPRSIAVPM
jgi:hypothetical protein